MADEVEDAGGDVLFLLSGKQTSGPRGLCGLSGHPSHWPGSLKPSRKPKWLKMLYGSVNMLFSIFPLQEKCVEDWPEDSPELSPNFKPVSQDLHRYHDPFLFGFQTTGSNHPLFCLFCPHQAGTLRLRRESLKVKEDFYFVGTFCCFILFVPAVNALNLFPS